MRIFYELFVIAGLLTCAGRSDRTSQDLCTEKYVSEKWNAVVYHSNEWSAYEFYGNNIGLEYRGLQNLERRSDAEVVISFFPNPLPGEEFEKIFDISQAKKEWIADSLGAELNSRITDMGFTQFVNRKWKRVEIEEQGSFEGEKYNGTETNYLWHSDDMAITIKVRVTGGEIAGLAEEIDCILNKLVFN